MEKLRKKFYAPNASKVSLKVARKHKTNKKTVNFTVFSFKGL